MHVVQLMAQSHNYHVILYTSDCPLVHVLGSNQATESDKLLY